VEAILARNITKGYGEKRVLDCLSLAVERSSRRAVYGPTGAGKSTLLYVIAGLVRPDSGQLEILGRKASCNGAFLPPEERGIGMVFQKALLWPHRNVRQNVEFALLAKRLSAVERKERALEALSLFGVEDLAERRPETLSGGQTQRVALARSIVARPTILLWDEPFSGLDDETRAEVAERALEYMGETGTTLVMVSHRREDAAAVEATVLTLREGRLVE
jgi:iron(III) transport system ATP-binding protein